MTCASPSLDTLFAWIRTESPTHDVAGVNLMMDLVMAQVQDAPVAVERIKGEQGLGWQSPSGSSNCILDASG